MQKQTHPQQQRKILPHYFKNVGRGVTILGLILFFSKLVVDFVNPYIGFGLMLIGLLLFAFANEKIKNEIAIKSQQNQPGLPNYFKKIGLGLVFFAILVLIPAIIWLKKFNNVVLENHKQLVGIVIIDIIYIGFLLFILAREKIDDELIVKIRLQSLATAFIFGIGWVIVNPIIHYILYNKIEDAKNQNVILLMLVMYVVMFHFGKKNR